MTEGTDASRAGAARTHPRRSKPLLIAPLIPGWAIVGIFAVDYLHGTRLLLPFVALWTLLALALFGYVLRQAIEQKRRRSPR